MNRRRFFRSHPVLGDAEAGSALAGDLSFVRVSRRAMATTFEIALPFGTSDAVEAASDALDLIDDIEDELTVYRDTSDISRLNAVAADEPVVVGEELFGFLRDCAALACDTEGAFDAAAGALVKAWGFYRRQGRVPTPAERRVALEASGMRHVVLDERERTVKFRRPGLELNFGAVGKGYALDRAAGLLRRRWGIGSALLQGGGSSVLALGSPPGRPRGWPVAVRHPHDDERTLGTLWLRDQALGTSAATFQYFVYNGRKYGHILDPRTGTPAGGVASSSAVAPTAAEADALSTAFFVAGADFAGRFCRPRPGVGAVVLAGDRLTISNLPASRYDAPAARHLSPLPDA